MTRRWVTGWKLHADDRERLLERFKPLFPDLVADHVTLRTGTNAITPLPREKGGEVVGEIDEGQASRRWWLGSAAPPTEATAALTTLPGRSTERGAVVR